MVLRWQADRLGLHSFPTRRSSDLAGTGHGASQAAELQVLIEHEAGRHDREFDEARLLVQLRPQSERAWRVLWRTPGDRKSTRLNSSHANISYAVFCLKKKNNQPTC